MLRLLLVHHLSLFCFIYALYWTSSLTWLHVCLTALSDIPESHTSNCSNSVHLFREKICLSFPSTVSVHCFSLWWRRCCLPSGWLYNRHTVSCSSPMITRCRCTTESIQQSSNYIKKANVFIQLVKYIFNGNSQYTCIFILISKFRTF